MNYKKIKSQLYNECMNYMQQRVKHAQQAFDDASESGNDETKSSAGDKHETGRAMMQIEQEQNAKQLHEAAELKKAFDKINPEQESRVAVLGSLIVTNKGNFYISISAGKIIIDDKIYFAVSPLSPIALKLLGVVKKQEIDFNGQHYAIEEVV
jgi:hypothetical protein